MVVLRDTGAAATDEEVEVRTAVGLLHVVEVQLHVAAAHRRLRRCPAGATARQFRIVDLQMQTSALDVELDQITALDQREVASGCRLR